MCPVLQTSLMQKWRTFWSCVCVAPCRPSDRPRLLPDRRGCSSAGPTRPSVLLSIGAMSFLKSLNSKPLEQTESTEINHQTKVRVRTKQRTQKKKRKSEPGGAELPTHAPDSLLSGSPLLAPIALSLALNYYSLALDSFFCIGDHEQALTSSETTLFVAPPSTPGSLSPSPACLPGEKDDRVNQGLSDRCLEKGEENREAYTEYVIFCTFPRHRSRNRWIDLGVCSQTAEPARACCFSNVRVGFGVSSRLFATPLLTLLYTVTPRGTPLSLPSTSTPTFPCSPALLQRSASLTKAAYFTAIRAGSRLRPSFAGHLLTHASSFDHDILSSL